MSRAHLKLGRVAPSLHQRKRALPLARYMTAPLPPAPDECDMAAGAPIAMWDNDEIGDCTIAAVANLIAIWCRIEGRPFTVTLDKVRAAYFALTGGADSGLVELDVLAALSGAGIALGEDEPTRVAAWVSVPVGNMEARSSLIAIFGGLYLGVELPLAAQTQDTWLTPLDLRGKDRPGSWGGHALLEAGYTADGVRKLVTWGAVQRADEMWLRAYCDEAYVLLDAKRAGVIGVDWDRLLADLAAVPAE